MPDQLADAGPIEDLKKRGRRVVRFGKRQILLIHQAGRVIACDNRCPHEGYPLSEGDLSEDCLLTCNWHNWKFDLTSGETLIGGDQLRHYPVAIENDHIFIDVTDPPIDEQIQRALTGLQGSFGRYEYDRMGREIARLATVGGDPLDAVRSAIDWTYDRFEYGMTHALAAAPDWLSLGANQASGSPEALVPYLEVVSYLAWDSLREQHYPFATDVRPFQLEEWLAAIECEDEPTSIAMLRGALAARLSDQKLRAAFARAALAHYADFGHSLIYVQKAFELISKLGDRSREPILFALLRSLINASREDRLPEFRGYAGAVQSFGENRRGTPITEEFKGASIRQALDLTASAPGDPLATWHDLYGAIAWNMLHFDVEHANRTDRPPAHNVNWLSFTHGLTFAHAVRDLCAQTPELWPQGLLQMACFAGRNAGYLDRGIDETAWSVDEPKSFLVEQQTKLLDHGQVEPIVSAHLIKLTTAVARDLGSFPDAPWHGTVTAAVNRFLHSPFKRKHTLRTMRQAQALVD